MRDILNLKLVPLRNFHLCNDQNRVKVSQVQNFQFLLLMIFPTTTLARTSGLPTLGY